MPTDRERTEAQEWAAGDYLDAKYSVQFDAKRDGCIHDTSRCYLAMMRNAWVAYHAGAPWMRHPAAFQAGMDAAAKMLHGESARLRAEIKRLRAERDRLQDLASMACENPCGDCAGCLTAHELLAEETL